VELRLWAQQYFDQENSRIWPLPRSESPARGGPVAAATSADLTGPAEELKHPTVIVTGAGGPAGVAVIRALRAKGVRTVGADADELAVGLRLADMAGVLPRSDDPTFVHGVCKLARRTRATALISTMAEEMTALNREREMLTAAGLSIWLPDDEAIAACVDKWRLAQVLEAAGVPAPPTGLGSADGVPAPWIVKPRFGRGSRDVYTADLPGELAWPIRRVPEPIVQTRLEGLEFTVDALVDHDGTLVAAVPRWRLETKAGISSKGRTFKDETVDAAVETLLGAIGLRGPANVQGFILASDGSLAITEVNPRFSGGLPLSLAAGADLVGEYLRGVVGQPIRRDRLTYRPGVTMTRHLEDVIES
jgi:carbamoyl-phosphate synthase large subunit